MTVMSWEWPPTRTFRAFAKLHKSDHRLRPSMNGRMDIVVDKVPNAITVPAKAVHTRNGKPMVYIARAAGYQAAEVEVIARNPDEVAIRGIDEGTEVTLIEPEDGPSLPVRALPSEKSSEKSLAAGQEVSPAGKQARP
jgi:hypothetical protein